MSETEQKVCLVTGATSGIGRATALALARAGATVIVVARDTRKGQAVVEEIKAATGNARAEPAQADLSSLNSIRALAADIGRRFPRLDVLVNSAAVFGSARKVTADGLETMFATNHLAYFLLTNLLVEPLRASGGGRVLNLTAPSTVKPDWNDLQGERSFNAMTAFGATKMENLLFTFEAARRLAKYGITVNAVHPGLVKTNLMRDAPALMRAVSAVVNLRAAGADRAVEPIVRLALAPEFAGVTGRFFKDTQEIEPPAYARDAEAQRRLWEESARLANLAAGTAI